MKNRDKLIALVDKISKRENKSPDVVVSELNNMSEEELNKKLRTMNIFKEGGKLEYIKCLKRGGNLKECGCGCKVKKAQNGTITGDSTDVNNGDRWGGLIHPDIIRGKESRWGPPEVLYRNENNRRLKVEAFIPDKTYLDEDHYVTIKETPRGIVMRTSPKVSENSFSFGHTYRSNPGMFGTKIPEEWTNYIMNLLYNVPVDRKKEK